MPNERNTILKEVSRNGYTLRDWLFLLNSHFSSKAQMQRWVKENNLRVDEIHDPYGRKKIVQMRFAPSEESKDKVPVPE